MQPPRDRLDCAAVDRQSSESGHAAGRSDWVFRRSGQRGGGLGGSARLEGEEKEAGGMDGLVEREGWTREERNAEAKCGKRPRREGASKKRQSGKNRKKR